MSWRVAPEEAESLEGVLDDLLPQEPELAYGNFLPIASRPGAAVALHRGRWLNARGLVGVWVARDGRRPVAALRVITRPFESQHFGIRAVKIEPPVAVRDSDERAAALRQLYPAVVEALRTDGCEHAAARASTRDRAAAWVLQETGFFHVDTQVSWMCPLTGTPHDEPLPAGLSLSIHDAASIARVEPAHWRRLADWAGTAFDRGPFVFDLSMPYAPAKGIYRAWTEKVMAGDWADAVLLVSRGEEAVAFISMRILRDVSEAAGALVCGEGLGATLPEYRGLFTTIQREMIAARPLGASFMENETQVATIGSINVYAKLGFRYLRSTSTYHRRVEGGGPS